jgi:methyl-accepting chemotaxis protein
MANVTTSEKITTIGIVGSGRGGCEILKIMKDIPSVSIEFLSDINPSAPGIDEAKKYNIRTSTEPGKTVAGIETEIIIEATGSVEILELLNNNKSENTTIVSGKVALFMFKILEENKARINSRVKNEIEVIRDGIADDVEKVNEFLLQINEVTTGMKVLAINAAVEAARAGAAGAGFGVVAGEIKNISDKTKSMAASIREITGSISDLSLKINIAIEELQ